jgi:GNAT superfamily N-acetyltransferase
MPPDRRRERGGPGRVMGKAGRRSVRIRRLGTGDEKTVLRSSYLFDTPPVQSAVRSYLADARNVFLIAERDGAATGFLRGTELGQLSSRRRQMFLYEIAVAGPHRRRGIGRALVLSLLEYCRARRFDEVFVFTDPANTAAVRLYRSTGAVTETPADRMYVYPLSAIARSAPAPRPLGGGRRSAAMERSRKPRSRAGAPRRTA